MVANRLAVAIQFKMEGWRIDTRMSRACVHELADGTRLVSARIILPSIGSRHPRAEQKEHGTGWTKEGGGGKKPASSHRESVLIKAPFYTFRWHRGITSVSRYFFHPLLPLPPPRFCVLSVSVPLFFSPTPCRFFIPLSSFFPRPPFIFRQRSPSSRSFFSLSLFSLCFVFATSDTRDMKLRERERRRDPMRFTAWLFALNCFQRSILGPGRIVAEYREGQVRASEQREEFSEI